MKIRFAKSTGCFYPFSENYVELPADIIEVLQEDFDAAMSRNPGDTLEVIDGRIVVIPKPAPTLAQLKAEAWDAIKAERDRRKSGGVKVGAKWFHTDDGSKTQHLANKDTARDQLAAGGQMGDFLLDPATGAKIPWKTMDGTFIPLTVQLTFDIVKAAKSGEFAIFAAAETHRAAMEASADPASYDYSGGWPKVYGE